MPSIWRTGHHGSWWIVCTLFLIVAASVQAIEEEKLMGWQGETYSHDRVFGHMSAAAAENPWVEVVSWTPRAFVYHNFLSEDEANHMLALAAPQMRRSTVVGKKEESGGVVDNIRTSYGMFIPRMYDSVVESVEQRLANWTHMPLEFQEDIQILRYTYGQKYGAHYDALGRVATVLIYLTDTEEGGETAFPQDSEWIDPSMAERFGPFSECAEGHVAVKPRKGTALLFFSLKPDGKSADAAALHTGCPVTKGLKWTATVWIHPQPFRPEWLEAAKNTEEPRPPPTDPGICQDDHDSCQEWSGRGECQANPSYMLEHCRFSCSVCKHCAEGDRRCYMANREQAGYLTLDEEIQQLTGYSIQQLAQ